MARNARPTRREYPRTARLNELLREILAGALSLVDDARLEQVSITTVLVEGDLRHATVLFDTLQMDEEGDAAVIEAFADHRIELQAAIARQARMKRTPMLTFAPDEAVRAGERIDHLLGRISEPDQ